MTTASVLDTHDMVLVHRVFRRELGLLPGAVRAAAGDRAQVQRVKAHAEELMAFLHHHHAGEDALVWPRLRARVVLERELVDRMEAQHEQVAELVAAVEDTLPVWDGTDAVTAALSALLGDLHAALCAHLDEEEARILPLVAETFTQAEWDELGERGFAAVPPRRRLVTLAHILEEADDAESRAFLSHVPAPARVAYRLLGRRQHARETAALRVPRQR